ncbi:hypothetical protein V1477_015411 [Vespula maculifrons]|uniref:Uncharacterized protein n=1 Tax=Vespula maculifrons TaxID=7453 RepID=A0ABD2BFR7_VESMC
MNISCVRCIIQRTNWEKSNDGGDSIGDGDGGGGGGGGGGDGGGDGGGGGGDGGGGARSETQSSGQNLSVGYLGRSALRPRTCHAILCSIDNDNECGGLHRLPFIYLDFFLEFSFLLLDLRHYRSVKLRRLVYEKADGMEKCPAKKRQPVSL